MKAENDSTCPTDIGFVWKYYNGSNWMDAGNGIVIRCESDIKLADLVKDPENIPYLVAGGVGLLALVVLLLTGSYCAYKRRHQTTTEVKITGKCWTHRKTYVFIFQLFSNAAAGA